MIPMVPIAAVPLALLLAQPCERLAQLSLPQVAITVAESRAPGAFTPAIGTPIPNLPAFCRVAGSIKPTADSDIRFEVWMPQSDWNGRFLGIGNGGFAGSIGYGQLASAVSRGYASASTDTGHQGSSTDASWALNHPEKIVDFGHRAIHLTAVNSKAILRAFYGRSPARSYFASCSNGGRQALMEAQRYPEDYDGILAGAPANNWTRLLANAAWNMLALLANKESYIAPSKLPAIQAAGLAACDTLDGIKDGIISDPARCRFDPAPLLCRGPETDACLTAPQLAALRKLYAGARTSDGRQVFPGYPPGGEADSGAWQPWITGTAPERSLMYAFATQFFKNMVFNDPAWDFRTFNLDRDHELADRKMGPILNATDPDLTRFKNRGGKLILYHGWCDAAIAAGSTIDYYNGVKAKFGPAATGSFVHLVMFPGMQHCGGPGDPAPKLAQALERWVENGVSPER
jgi:hypothetical protein